MPKAAQHIIAWSTETNGYALCDDGGVGVAVYDGPAWQAWLDQHHAFAFVGRAGRINLLKEARNGEGYWYAYRRTGKRTSKRYAGRNAALALAHLEALAVALAPQAPAAPVPPDEPFVPQTPAAVTGSASATVPLLAPKLQPPRLQSDLVPRQRLFDLLDAGLGSKLMLVTAPAGFGKTTLVRQWLASSAQFSMFNAQLRNDPATQTSNLKTQNFNVAWLSLDEGDNDLLRFWRYVIAACQSIDPKIGQASLALLANALQPPFDGMPYEVLLTPLLNDLVQYAQPIMLVLDDYHLIDDGQIHAAMAFLLDHLPAALHLVLLTRGEAPLPLARLRASGDLHTVSVADLRFSPAETRTLLEQRVALPLGPQELQQVDSQLEGWAAGLRLLTLALHQHAAPEALARVLASFSGNNRLVFDYFVAEVLQAQPPAVQTFLLHTALLDRLSGPLCDAIVQPTSSNAPAAAAILEHVVRANLFLEPLDEHGNWYRYHALFAEAMGVEARRHLGDAAVQQVISTASGWYEHNGMLAEAINAALAAHEPARAARLIEQSIGADQFIISSYYHTFAETLDAHAMRRWVEQLPQPILEQHPLICLSCAIALLLALFTGEMSRSTETMFESVLLMAERGFRAAGNTSKLGEVLAFQSLVAKQRGLIDESVRLARQALAMLPVESIAWRSVGLSSIGVGEFMAGRLGVARVLLSEALAISVTVNNYGFSRAIIGMTSGVLLEQAELHHAAEIMRQNLAEARAQGDYDDIGHAQIILTHISYERNALAAAAEQAREVYEVSIRIDDEEFQARALLWLAQIAHARGQPADALAQATTLIAWLQPQRPLRMRWHLRNTLAVQASFHLAAGDLAAVQRWADGRERDATALPLLQHAREELLRARLLVAQETPAAALALLVPLLENAQREGHPRFAIEARIVAALAHATCGHLPEARQHLHAALAAAATEGFVRVFVDAGPALATLLRSTLPHIHERPLSAYARTVLRAFADAPAVGSLPMTSGEPLSAQEQRVLDLLANGYSNPEIAARLVVSVNTVKAHLKNIFRKLDVRNRTEAARVAVK